MGQFITSKTHKYVNIIVRPSRYYMKLFHQYTDMVKYKKGADKFYEFVDKKIKFDNLFYEFITKKPSENIYTDYFPFREESVKEEIRDVSGILICEGRRTMTYCIPINDKTEEVIKFIKENCELTITQPSKTNGSYYDHGVSTYWRDKCKENSEKVMDSDWYKTLAEERKDG